MWSSFDIASLLFVFAAAIGIANDRTLRLPRPIALLIGALVASLGLMAVSALLPHHDIAGRSEQRIAGADLPAVLLDGVLALLLFATSLQADVSDLRRRARPIFWLATLGVGISLLLFGFGIQAILAFSGIAVPLAWCLVLGAILAPTDAVAVEQLLAHVRLPAELRSIISGESLFNDGAAVVFFFAALATATGSGDVFGHGKLISRLVIDGGGGAALGFATGWIARQAMRYVREEHLAVTVTLALVLATYRLAVTLELSGPIAVVVCGLTLCHYRAGLDLDAPWRARIREFWAMADELVNTLLFMLMGFEVLAIPFESRVIVPVLAAIPLALVVRFASVAVPLSFGRRDRRDRLRSIGVLTWTGLRGGISIALVLALPPSPYREILAVICYAVVIFTVIVQGLTTPRVVGWIYRGARESSEKETREQGD